MKLTKEFIKGKVAKDAISPAEGSVLKDIANEEKFLSEARKKIELMTELEVMSKIYEDQLRQFTGLRFDVEMLTYLTLVEPNVPQHAANLTKTKTVLRNKRKLISIIRNQIVEKTKGEDGQKN